MADVELKSGETGQQPVPVFHLAMYKLTADNETTPTWEQTEFFRTRGAKGQRIGRTGGGGGCGSGFWGWGGSWGCGGRGRGGWGEGWGGAWSGAGAWSGVRSGGGCRAFVPASYRSSPPSACW